MSIDPRSASAEELLQALTVGDVPADDPAVIARLGADAQLRARWQALAATLAELRELDTGHRDGGGIAEAQVDTRAAVRAFRRRAARRSWLVVATAAAALLAVLWLLGQERRQVTDPTLGSGGRIGALSPDGVDWPADEPLRWSAVHGAAGYRVQVQALPDGAVLVLPDGPAGEWIVTNSWLPSAPARAALPARFQWRVLAFDGSNVSIATSAWATARR
jgi:hypothetical protein